jgi:acyl carrier protein
MPDPAFLAIVRGHLRYLPADQPLDPDVPLRELGLDSMAAVALMFDLEDAYATTLDDDNLLAHVFRTAGTLWAAVNTSSSRAATTSGRSYMT